MKADLRYADLANEQSTYPTDHQRLVICRAIYSCREIVITVQSRTSIEAASYLHFLDGRFIDVQVYSRGGSP